MYARCDSHYLIPLWRLMRARLLAEDNEANRMDAREEAELLAVERLYLEAKRTEERTAEREKKRQKEEAKERNDYRQRCDGEQQHGLALPDEICDELVGEDESDVGESAGRVSPRSAMMQSPTAISNGSHFSSGSHGVGALGSGQISPAACGGKRRGRSGSPVAAAAFAEEPWTSHWEDPEDCHRQQRSRSGSFFRSELESIHEKSDSIGNGIGIGFAAGGAEIAEIATAGRLFGEREAVATFIEEDEEGEGEEDGEMDTSFMDNGGVGGSDGSDDNDDHDDEDEDLWEGWGHQEGDFVVPELEPALDQGQERTDVEANSPAEGTVIHGVDQALPPEDTVIGGDDQTPMARSLPPVANTPVVVSAADEGDVVEGGGGSGGGSTNLSLPNSRIPAAIETGPSSMSIENIDESRVGSKQGMERGVQAPVQRQGGSSSKGGGGRVVVETLPYEYILHRDGVRLLWKTLSRTQMAAGLLWHRAPDARREGAHNERHFRTAVQRLTAPRWSEVNVYVYEEIYLWRDRTARRLDDGPTYVCAGDILIDVALALPKTIDALRRVSCPLSPVLGNGDTPEAVDLVKVVRVALGLPEGEAEVLGEEKIYRGAAVVTSTADASGSKDGEGGVGRGRVSMGGETMRGVAVLAMAAVTVGLITVLAKRGRP